MTVVTISLLVVLCLVLGMNIFIYIKMMNIFSAFDNVIIKTLTNTSMIEKNKLFVDALTKFSENDRNRKDKEYSELKSIAKAMDVDLKSCRVLIDSLRKEKRNA